MQPEKSAISDRLRPFAGVFNNYQQTEASLSILATSFFITCKPYPYAKADSMTFTNPIPMEEQLLRTAPDAILIVDKTGHILNSNPLSEKLFGYHREELLGMPVENLIPPRLRGRHRRNLSEYFKEPRTRPMGTGLETLSLRRDGSEFETEISLGPLHTPKGTIVLTAIRDISVVKRAQRALEQATYELEKTIEQQDAELLQVAANLRKQVAERLQTDAALGESIRQKTAILNNIPDIAWLKDRDSRFIAVNEPFGEACGVAPAKLVGKTDLDIWPQDLARS